MAAKVADNAMEDVANSLTEAEVVPTKLRCAICDKVAFNAFKLPCCDQNICGNCQSSLPAACPICQHSPLNGEDAKPSKSLRLTVAQFLKSVKKKREKAQSATGGDNTPTSAVEPVTPVVDAIPAASVDATLEPSETLNDTVELAVTPLPEGQQNEFDSKQDVEATAERVAEEDAELQELEATTIVIQPHQSTHDEEAEANNDDDAESDTSDIEIVTGDEDKTAANPWGQENEEEYQEEEEQWVAQDGQNQMQGQGFGYQGGDQGDMSMFGGMNPEMMQMMMQQMAGMQNGQWPNMMGMPGMGMGMNPMDMFAAFGMQGMGGMNPNMMNMNGMSGMMGMDFNGNFGGGWNGQQMGGGDFGASSGYYPDGGYNQSSHQGNYPPHMSHRNQQFSMKNNSYNQQGSFRGSNRGFGRGYHNQGYHNRSHSQNFPGATDGPPPNAPTGPKAQREAADSGIHQQAYNQASSRPGSDHQQPSAMDDSANKEAANYDDKQQVSDDARDVNKERTSEQPGRDSSQLTAEDVNGPTSDMQIDKPNDTSSYSIQTNGTPNESHYRGGYRGRGGYEPRGGFRGRGGPNWQYHGTRGPETQATPPAEPVGLGVEGAPSGPKAMRENATWPNRGRGGFSAGGRGTSQSVSSVKPDEYSSDVAAKATAAYKANSQPDSRARSSTRSPSRERSRSASRKHSRRHRSRTPSSDSEHERRKERKRRRAERKYEDEYNDTGHEDDRQGQTEADDDKYRSSRREHDRVRSSKSQRDSSRERRKHRRRSRTPDRQDDLRDETQATFNGDDLESKDKDRRRDRDKYRERSKDRDRHREKDRDREREKKRSSRRDRSASPSSQHRSSHRSSRDKDKDKERDREQRDKDRESRRASAASISKTSRPDTPNVQKQLEQGFRIHGRSKEKERDRQKAEAVTVVETAIPLAAPPAPASDINAKMQPPTGPRADRGSAAPGKFKLDIAHLNTKTSAPSGPRNSTNSSRRPSQPVTPTSAVTPKESTPIDPYEAERRKAQEARIAKEFSRRKGSDTGPAPLTKKRSFADVEEEVPTGPRDKKTKKGRKMSYKYEDEYGDVGLGEGERERESARYR